MSPPRPQLNRLQQRALQYVAEATIAKHKAAEEARKAAELLEFRIVAAAKLGCSYEQIAENAGLTKGRVGQIVKRAR
jgi:DNA-directed RNA polymerase specialized sigma24 family protein